MLSVADVHVAYGKTPALTGPSLVVGAGEIVSIIGRNGVGKTTLLKAIIGLLRVTSGAIHLDGLDVTRLPAHERARRGLGYVPQGRMIFADLTVEENLLIGADLNRATRRAPPRPPRGSAGGVPHPADAVSAARRHPLRGRTADARHRPGARRRAQGAALGRTLGRDPTEHRPGDRG